MYDISYSEELEHCISAFGNIPIYCYCRSMVQNSSSPGELNFCSLISVICVWRDTGTMLRACRSSCTLSYLHDKGNNFSLPNNKRFLCQV